MGNRMSDAEISSIVIGVITHTCMLARHVVALVKKFLREGQPPHLRTWQHRNKQQFSGKSAARTAV
jgi:hypothetical protein